jgi:predicted ATP-grasp superfamily ATP-dependent carboligase
MRIFVVEYITGGGLADRQISAELLNEAEAMLGALLDDLSLLPEVDLLVSRDPRLPALNYNCGIFTPVPGGDVWEAWKHCIDSCDAVWAIMPETGGLLERISHLTLARMRPLIGSHPSAVAVAASKLQTAETLQRAGIDVVPTYAVDNDIPAIQSRWVLKPDDGVGGEGAHIFESYEAMIQALRYRDRYSGYVAQPVLEGKAGSLSLLCRDRSATLLTANCQQVREVGGRFVLDGVLVNGLPAAHVRYASLARAIARAIPGLWGYAGVDMVLTGNGPVVLEVNPRLTLSYAGLRSVLAVNPAKLILRMLHNDATLPSCTPVTSVNTRVVPGEALVA